jgi:putative transposase
MRRSISRRVQLACNLAEQVRLGMNAPWLCNRPDRRHHISVCIVQPRRRVVEKSLSWIGRCRRLSRDYEALPEVSEAMVTLAAIRLMLHRLTHSNRKRLPAP